MSKLVRFQGSLMVQWPCSRWWAAILIKILIVLSVPKLAEKRLLKNSASFAVTSSGVFSLASCSDLCCLRSLSRGPQSRLNFSAAPAPVGHEWHEAMRYNLPSRLIHLQIPQRAVVVFSPLALEADSVSARILYNAFPIEEMFPAIVAMVGKRFRVQILSLFSVFLCVGRFHFFP